MIWLRGQGYSLAVQHLPGKHGVLRSIPGTLKKNIYDWDLHEMKISWDRISHKKKVNRGSRKQSYCGQRNHSISCDSGTRSKRCSVTGQEWAQWRPVRIRGHPSQVLTAAFLPPSSQIQKLFCFLNPMPYWILWKNWGRKGTYSKVDFQH